MASKMGQRHRQATVLVTEETLGEALQAIRDIVQQIGHGDPRVGELKRLYNEIAPYIRGGDSGVFDDAENPEVARKLKAAVEHIRQVRNEVLQPAHALVQGSDTAKEARGHLECLQCEHGGFKNQQGLDNHMDSAHRGRLASETKEGAPMSSKLFARKKRVEAEDEMLDAAPEAVAGDAPAEPLPEGGIDMGAAPAPAPAGPAVAPPTAGNPFANLPTEALSVIVEALTKIDQFESNPAILGAIENVAEELKNRPVQPAAVEGAPKAASRKTAVTPPGREDQVKALKKEPGIDNPWAVAWHSYNESHEGASEAPPQGQGWSDAAGLMQSTGLPAPQANVLAHWMKEQGYTPHKAAFMLRRAAACLGCSRNLPPSRRACPPSMRTHWKK